ncbi:MAG: hemin-degrading factor [Ectothiorhodospiraceae bacterium]|nr:hemin-degrading factor [Ectothiorhodospiraceae bacterium]
MQQTINTPDTSATGLRERWQSLRASEPSIRIRNAANRLGVSELALLLTETSGNVRRLRPEFPMLYRELLKLGPIMALARNDEVVHETTGTMGPFSIGAHADIGLCLGEIDLRVFFRHWAHGYAVSEKHGRRTRRSLQFFDASGMALHKIFAVRGTSREAWNSLVERFSADVQRPQMRFTPAARPERSSGIVDRDALAADWAGITDVHQFHDVLLKHRVDRLTALEMMEGQWSRPLVRSSLERLLKDVAAAGTPIMAFAGNRGIIQIYTGRIRKLLRTGDWFNVLDPDFNLHVRTTDIASVWTVRRPSEDGDITSLDCFNAHGDLVLSLFGERKPGKPELASWRHHIEVLEQATNGGRG